MKLGKKLIETLELIKYYKVISREDIARILKINLKTAASRVGSLREAGYNIQSFPLKYPKRIYKFPETSSDLSFVSHNRELNGKTHLKNWLKNILELVKKNPKLYKQIFLEQQGDLLDAITIKSSI